MRVPFFFGTENMLRLFFYKSPCSAEFFIVGNGVNWPHSGQDYYEGKARPKLWKNYVPATGLQGKNEDEGGSVVSGGKRRPDLASRPTRSQKVAPGKAAAASPHGSCWFGSLTPSGFSTTLFPPSVINLACTFFALQPWVTIAGACHAAQGKIYRLCSCASSWRTTFFNSSRIISLW